MGNTLKVVYFKIAFQAGVEMSLLYVNVIACALTFRPINKLASNLLIPYIAWVSFAGLINYSIWKLNKNNPSAST